MTVVDVDGLSFEFPEDWRVAKCDAWGFYRDRWCRMGDGIKATDLLALDPSRVAWFVEVKDYRTQRRTKSIDLVDEVAAKVFDTLAALLPAAIGATDHQERGLAKAVLGATRLRVVLHLEQPKSHSKLFPRRFDPAHLKQKLRQRVRAIDAHPAVIERGRMGGVGWILAGK